MTLGFLGKVLVVAGVAGLATFTLKRTVWSKPAMLKKGPRMPNSSDTPVLDLLTTMTAASLEASTLDAKTLMLARIAALVAVDAPPASYLLNLGAATDVGIDEEAVRGVLIAIAPVVGTPRVMAAAGNIMRALGFAIAVAEADAEAVA